MHGLRLLVPALLLVGTAWAADPFIGNWKLNVAKSDFGSGPKAQSGSTTYEAATTGYKCTSETVFGENQTARLAGPIQFDGTVNQGGLDGRAVAFVSKKITDNSYEVLLTDKETGKISHTFKYTVVPADKTLTFTWTKTGEEQPFMKLFYDKQ